MLDKLKMLCGGFLAVCVVVALFTWGWILAVIGTVCIVIFLGWVVYTVHQEEGDTDGTES